MASWYLNVLCVVAVIAVTSAKDCTVDNNVHADGEEFQTEDSGKCIFYKCTDGAYKPSKKQCLDPTTATCKDIDQTYKAKCVTYVCKDNAEGIGFVITGSECEGDKGCFKPGDEFEKTFEGVVYSKTTCRVEDGKVLFAFAG